MENLQDASESWNVLGHLCGGKCTACKKTPTDNDVLRCCYCKKLYHVLNCAESNKDDLPPPSSLKLYIKFAGKEFPFGAFSWSCFRCKSMQSLTEKSNLEERVDLLEALLITLAPQMQAVNALGRSNSHDVVKELVTKIRFGTSVDVLTKNLIPLVSMLKMMSLLTALWSMK